MMTGILFIDNQDAYTTWGVYLTGGLRELVQYAPLKPYEYNDWPEEDGIEPDLSAPRLAGRTVRLTFAYTHRNRGFDDFRAHWADGAYHDVRLPTIERSYRLRLIAGSSLSYAERAGSITLELADDFPLAAYSYQPPEGHYPLTRGGDYRLDDRPLAAYGLSVLEGTLDSIMEQGTVKPALKRDMRRLHGVSYDPQRVTYRAREVSLRLLLRADTLTALWRAYDALLYDLVRPGERTLWVGPVAQSFDAVYKSQTVTAFYPEGKLWLEFTLTLTLTRGARPSLIGTALSTEQGTPLAGETGQYIIGL